MSCTITEFFIGSRVLLHWRRRYRLQSGRKSHWTYMRWWSPYVSLVPFCSHCAPEITTPHPPLMTEWEEALMGSPCGFGEYQNRTCFGTWKQGEREPGRGRRWKVNLWLVILPQAWWASISPGQLTTPLITYVCCFRSRARMEWESGQPWEIWCQKIWALFLISCVILGHLSSWSFSFI